MITMYDYAPCGLDCSMCPVYIATQEDDDELREETAAEWTTLYAAFLEGKKLKASDMFCDGCRSERLFTGCASCLIRPCAAEKKLVNCGKCGEARHCTKLQGFLDYNPAASKNLFGD